jgi:hypothetical protein
MLLFCALRISTDKSSRFSVITIFFISFKV